MLRNLSPGTHDFTIVIRSSDYSARGGNGCINRIQGWEHSTQLTNRLSDFEGYVEGEPFQVQQARVFGRWLLECYISWDIPTPDMVLSTVKRAVIAGGDHAIIRRASWNGRIVAVKEQKQDRNRKPDVKRVSLC